MLPKKMTRTEKTERAYSKRWHSLISRYVIETEVSIEFTDWLPTHFYRLRRSSIRYDKAALIHVYASCPEMVSLIRSIQIHRTNKKLRVRTSAKKQKKFNQDIREKLIKALREGTAIAKLTALWLHVGWLLGFRPCEASTYNYSRTQEGYVAVVIRNAKNTNERAHGPTRTLIFTDLNSSDFEMLRDFRALYDEFLSRGISAEKICRRCSWTLSSTIKRLHLRKRTNPTLYSLRHQFAADLKELGYPRTHVAAMMGHASDLTANRHYGKRRYGKTGRPHTLANPAEVDKVRTHNHKTWRQAPAPVESESGMSF